MSKNRSLNAYVVTRRVYDRREEEIVLHRTLYISIDLVVLAKNLEKAYIAARKHLWKAGFRNFELIKKAGSRCSFNYWYSRLDDFLGKRSLSNKIVPTLLFRATYGSEKQRNMYDFRIDRVPSIN